jgi:hypothetical protein
LKPKDSAALPELKTGRVSITFEKFLRTVLPTEKSIAMAVPHRGNFTALVTAANPDAPPIHQWDSLEKRNPVSWYVYHGGSLASQWHLTGGAWRAVTAVALQPSMWHGENAHHGRDALFILDGAVDMKEDSGNAIFPETLRSEFHGIRGTIEAYSRGAKLGGREQASACGHRAVGATVRVDAGSGVVSEYQIDRWE